MILSVFLLYSNRGEAQKYTLQQCLDFALNNSYALRRASLEIKEAEYQKQETQSGVLPQINASGGLDDNVVLAKMMLPGEIIGMPGENVAVAMGTKYVLDVSASLEQTIFSPTLFTGIQIAKTNVELQRLRAAMTKEEIIFNVSYAYYDILNSVQELEHLAYILAKQDSLYLLMKQRVEEGLVRETDLNRLKVNMTTLRINGENIRNTVAQQKRYLQILIGMSVNEPIELDDAIVGATLAVAPQIPQNNIELDILNKQKDMLALEIRQIKAGYLPTLSAVASGGYQFQAENLHLAKEPWFNSFLAGVKLSVPVFDGFGKRSQLRQKRIQMQRLETDLTETNRTISANYQNAMEQLRTTYKSIHAQNENLQLAEKVYAQTTMLYSEGLASLTDLLETENALHEAKTTCTSETIRYRKAEVDLLKATGRLEELIIKK
ncbi:MAG: TolC family protein [Tannerella sp.]|nr:TolC family protein [Tannerella sp.]